MKRLSILMVLLLVACGRSTPQQQTAHARALTPGASSGVPGGVLINPDFEQTATDGSIPGWNTAQHAGQPAYVMWIDAYKPYAGHGSFHVTRTQPQVYGSLTQTLDARAYAGKTVELSAMLKALGVGPGGWKLIISANMPGTLAYSPELTGDSAWTRESVRLSVPAKAQRLTVGVSLRDGGDGWMDNVELKVVD